MPEGPEIIMISRLPKSSKETKTSGVDSSNFQYGVSRKYICTGVSKLIVSILVTVPEAISFI